MKIRHSFPVSVRVSECQGYQKPVFPFKLGQSTYTPYHEREIENHKSQRQLQAIAIFRARLPL
jgi:hypothetical protein